MATAQPRQPDAQSSQQQGTEQNPPQQQQGQHSSAPTQQGMTLFRDWASI